MQKFEAFAITGGGLREYQGIFEVKTCTEKTLKLKRIETKPFRFYDPFFDYSDFLFGRDKEKEEITLQIGRGGRVSFVNSLVENGRSFKKMIEAENFVLYDYDTGTPFIFQKI